MEDNHNLLYIDDKTNPLCIVGGNIQETLNDVYRKIQKDAEASISEHSLQDIIDQILTLEKIKIVNLLLTYFRHYTKKHISSNLR